MKKLFFLTISLVISFKLFADLAVDYGYQDKLFHIVGIRNIPKDWVIYVSNSNDSDVKLLIQKDTEIELSGSKGEPNALIIWAYNNRTGAQTSKSYIYGNKKDVHYEIKLLKIENDRLDLDINYLDNLSHNKSKIDEKSNDTPIKVQEKDSIKNLSNNSKPIQKNEMDHVKLISKDSNQELILIGLALISFAFIGWIYIRKKRKD